MNKQEVQMTKYHTDANVNFAVKSIVNNDTVKNIFLSIDVKETLNYISTINNLSYYDAMEVVKILQKEWA
tara:strand:- start:164 stop:373 length:210 start_codon:yes stop_codon:yes gene_type:complete